MASIDPYVNAGGDIASSIINTTYNAYQANRQREWAEEMMDKQNAWSLEMWNKTNEYNDPKNQVARLTNAGLNPLYYGLDGSSANGLESAQPLNYERASASISNPMQAFMQAKIADKQIDLMNSEIDKNKAEAKGTGLDNEWKEKTMDARVQAVQLANVLTNSEIKKVDAEKDHVLEQIKETVARTQNEEERKFLIQAETWLKNANAYQIVKLLPYQQLLMEAQTTAEKASAFASYVHAAYEQKMIDEGYIEAMVNELNAKAKQEGYLGDKYDVEGSILRFERACKWGTLWEYNEDGGWFDKAVTNILNGTGKAISYLGVIFGPFTNIMAAGAGAGILRGSNTGNGLRKTKGKGKIGYGTPHDNTNVGGFYGIGEFNDFNISY